MIACPGFINTNVTRNALTGDGSSQNKQDNAQEKAMGPALFAQKSMKSIEKKEQEVYIGGREVIGVYIKRLLPKLFTKIISKAKVR